ncbi:lasso RiPP family leader peptide-containing protein [Dechloromonas sp. CZR5]
MQRTRYEKPKLTKIGRFVN